MSHGSHEEVIDLPVVRYEVVDPDALIPPLVDDRPAQHYGFNAGAEWECAQGGEGDSNGRYLRWLRKSPLLPGAVARRWFDSARAAGAPSEIWRFCRLGGSTRHWTKKVASRTQLSRAPGATTREACRRRCCLSITAGTADNADRRARLCSTWS